jgi:hypothetical protein
MSDNIQTKTMRLTNTVIILGGYAASVVDNFDGFEPVVEKPDLLEVSAVHTGVT